MAKQDWKPGTLIYPAPAVIVSCGSTAEEYNMLTVSWVGTICTNPPMCYISLRPERHSHAIIRRNMEFVINLTTRTMAHATDWCGVASGARYDKFIKTGLTRGKATLINAPTIEEAPICIECRVKEIIPLGSHDMFIADVVNVQADERYIDPTTGSFDMRRAELIAYSHGHYYELGNLIGRFGWSVKKSPKKSVKKSIKKK